MLDWIKVKFQYILPKHAISRLIGGLAAANAGWLTTKLISVFIKHYNVNMDEAIKPNAEDYATFNDFFTRELKPGVRPIDTSTEHLIFPVDGAVSQFGDITRDRVIQAKGHDYSLTSLLGGNPDIAAPFQGGTFSTIYLSPKDYHRIHMPMDATLTDMLYLPGELFSVNPLTTENVPGLFARNERVVCVFDSEHGPFAMVLVGATIVASIATVWAGTITPPAGKIVQHWRYPKTGEGSITLNKADEMGLFKLGSTVVMCFSPDMVEFTTLSPGMPTVLGEHFATLK